MKAVAFDEKINGRLSEGAAVAVTLGGKLISAEYLRPMLTKAHRCVIRIGKRKHTISTRKVVTA